MANKRLSIRVRVGIAIAGGRKSLIPALNVDDGVTFPGLGGRPRSFGSKQEQITALTGWVFAANSAIVEPCAAVELKLFRKDAKGERQEVTSGPDLELIELIDSPNFVHTGEQMRQLHFTYMNIVGESYIFMRDLSGDPFVPAKGKLPAALDIFPAHAVQFVLGESYTKSIVKVGTKQYPITSFIRDLNPDPANPFSGRSIIAASAATIGLDEQMKEWNQSVFANGARPSLVFKTPQELSDAAYERWKQQFVDTQTGVENAGKPLLIEGGDVTPLMLTQKDLDFLESRKFSRDEILAMFKVSPGMLGSVENVNRANLEAGFYINAVVNVVPRIRQFVRQVNATLVKVYDPSLELDFVNPVPEDVEAKLRAATAGTNKWWTIDETRALYGDKPLPDGQGEQIIITGPGATTLESVLAGTNKPAADVQDPDDPDGDGDDDLTEDPGGESADETKDKALHGVKKKN